MYKDYEDFNEDDLEALQRFVNRSKRQDMSFDECFIYAQEEFPDYDENQLEQALEDIWGDDD